MAHNIRFVDFHLFSILTRNEVIDLITMLFNGRDSNFIIVAKKADPKFMGQENYDAMSNTHTIMLVEKNIKKAYASKSPGGGSFYHPNIKVYASTILAHEIQHANQFVLHKNNMSSFWGFLGGVNAKNQWRMKRYDNRACEREACDFADDKLSVICSYFDADCPARERKPSADTSEVDEIVSVFLECDEVSMDDIKDELRRVKLLSPNNVLRVKEALEKSKVEITR